MPSSLPGDRSVATYVPTEMARAIDAAARSAGLSRAAFVRFVLKRALDDMAHAGRRDATGATT